MNELCQVVHDKQKHINISFDIDSTVYAYLAFHDFKWKLENIIKTIGYRKKIGSKKILQYKNSVS